MGIDANDKEGTSSGRESSRGAHAENSSRSSSIEIPKIELPKGGGALKGIDEKFSVNAANGTAAFSLPLPFSRSRSAFAPAVSLSYNSGSGNSAFGLGWDCGHSMIQRKTDKKLPTYEDEHERDVFLFSGAEDLVPFLEKDSSGSWQRIEFTSASGEKIKQYRPRIEGLFARIEQIKVAGDDSFYWKVMTRDNVTTFYGRRSSSRLTDPDDATRVFRWLPDLSYDDKGNCIQFEYIAEDLKNVEANIHERNRINGTAAFANKYLKRIRYGNKNPFYADVSKPFAPDLPGDPGYFYETVFDYGDHDEAIPLPAVQQEWPCRTDAFSEYRQGFEIRTYRLCKRILFFHYFSELSATGIVEPTLVRSIDMSHQYFGKTTGLQETDFITEIAQLSYRRNSKGGYDKRSLPAIEFSYHDSTWNTELHTVPAESFQHAPAGIGSGYQWVDFYGEGIAGIFSEQAGSWYYKNNLGNGNFAPARTVATKPSFMGLSSGALVLQDIESNGKKYVVANDAGMHGFFEQDGENSWLPFMPFENAANINLADPNTRLLDLNGDGVADIVISEENVFCWYPSLGRQGFDHPQYHAKSPDEEKGPAILFADGTQSIHLADMSGDGLTDIVRIRNGEICYWPNMGYGRFGAKVTMHHAPVFDTIDGFDPAGLYLADISGTGATDVLYFGNNAFNAWFNYSGNSWSKANNIDSIPGSVPGRNISVADFLGNGTGCIVLSSGLPGDSQNPMRYIDLTGGKKPFILSSYTNNLGKITSLEYKSSTQFYLADQAEGNDWITKLPFPVQCVSKLEVKDEITGVRFTSQYTYHHGYFDHAEREFRGFGRVDQQDAEIFDEFVRSGATNIVNEELHQAPVYSKTWYHTGAFFDREKILDQFAGEYFHNTLVAEHELPQPDLDDQLTAQEWREALRGCKGMLLRQEVYALDGTDKESLPYTVTAHNCCIDLVQPCAQNRYAVFTVKGSESVTYNYERNAADPRISHTLNLELDEYGNVLQGAAVVYGRQQKDAALPAQVQDEQARLYITYGVNTFTNDKIENAVYRLRIPCESISFELSGVDPDADYFTCEELLQAFAAATDIGYEETAVRTSPERRRIEHQRSLMLDDDTGTVLPLGELSALGLQYETYQLALTGPLITSLFGTRVTESILEEGGYTRSDDYKGLGLFPATDDDDEWWIRSGTVSYPAAPEDHFYAPEKFIDPLGSETKVTMYSDYHLLISKTEDAIGNSVEIEEFDFRSLIPRKMRDMNGCTSEVAIDILGFVTGMTVNGKSGEGDSLSGFNADLDQSDIDDFFNDPETHAAALLGNATGRFVYDYSRTHVALAAAVTIVREKHVHQLGSGETSPVQLSFEYSDGFGKTVMKKVQAEPGLAKQMNEDGTVTEIDTGTKLRWVGNGRTVLNNKAKPVKQFNSYFSVNHKYEDESGLVEIGVSPVIYYDAVGRGIRTEFPNGTFTRVEIDNWFESTYDSNDTVKDSAWYSERITGALSGDAQENSAAAKASVHSDTPGIAHFDSLGRAYYSTAHNAFTDRTSGLRSEEIHEYYIEQDIEGNTRKIVDARGNDVIRYSYDMLGTAVYQKSMDAGERWTLSNVLGNPVCKWDSKESVYRYYYDTLNRPSYAEVTEKGKPTIVTGRTEFGEALSADYFRGKIYRTYDPSGIVTNELYDFKGNVLKTTRQFCEEYKQLVDWTDPATVSMLTDIYTAETEFDGINRATKITAADSSEITPSYNETGKLEQLVVKTKGGLTHAFVTRIDYNEINQRTAIYYGNGTKTTYEYDPLTFRLKRLLTTRNSGTEILQDLRYVYDPAGNIVSQTDKAQDTIYFNNSVVEASGDFTYDSLYRLIAAAGREHAGGNAAVDEFDHHRMFDTTPGDGTAMQNYVQYYDYDAVGNMLKMVHNAGSGSFVNRWTRTFGYSTTNNQLLDTQVGSASPDTYSYDVHGNMLAMPHLKSLNWNYGDQLQSVEKGGSATDFNVAYYTYDAGGNRVRKVITYPNGVTEERIYLGGVVEIFTKKDAAMTLIRRETLHVMDDKRRVAMIDTKTIENDAAVNDSLIRYQLDNHLSTAGVELDENADIISYEEYYPFGSTAYQAMRSATEVPPKRYRYTGKERDEESGLYYHGARYYAPWLARWVSADPIGIKAGINFYEYVSANPIKMNDPTGTQECPGCPPMDPYYYAALAYGGFLEFIGGGSSTVQGPNYTVDNQHDGSGIGGVVGGVADTVTLRLTPLLEDNPTATSKMGMDMGGSMVPILGPGENLVTGKTTSGAPASRVENGVFLVLDIVPVVGDAVPLIAGARTLRTEARVLKTLDKVDDVGHIGAAGKTVGPSATNPTCRGDLCVADVGAHHANLLLKPGQKPITNLDFVAASGREVDRIHNPIVEPAEAVAFLQAGFDKLFSTGKITTKVHVDTVIGKTGVQPGQYALILERGTGRHAIHATVSPEGGRTVNLDPITGKPLTRIELEDLVGNDGTPITRTEYPKTFFDPQDDLVCRQPPADEILRYITLAPKK